MNDYLRLYRFQPMMPIGETPATLAGTLAHQMYEKYGDGTELATMIERALATNPREGA